MFGDNGTTRGGQVGDDGRHTGVRRFVPASPLTAVPAAAAFYSPNLIASAAGNAAVVEALTQLHDYRWPLAAVTVPLIAVDACRHRARRWSQMLESMVRQSTGHLPRRSPSRSPAGGAPCAARRSQCRAAR